MGLKAQFSKTFPSGLIIKGDIELALENFELIALFGPSGCGKTTILRCLSGLERPDNGYIEMDGTIWFNDNYNLAAYKRNIGYVFQDSALFPHLNVRQNIAYGLFNWPRMKRKAKVDELMNIMGIDELAIRKPGEISGGQKQKVALARALAIEPKLVLLDEPFASLDQVSASQLRYNLKQILKQLNTPAILVTHDHQEALSLGDKMLLMSNGLISKRGTPLEVLSSICSNNKVSFLPNARDAIYAKVISRRNGLMQLKVANLELYALDPGSEPNDLSIHIKDEGVLIIESTDQHNVTLPKHNIFSAVVLAIIDFGFITQLILDIGITIGAIITTWLLKDLKLEAGQKIQIHIKASAIQIVSS